MDKRDEAAVANAMLLGELDVRRSPPGDLRYAFHSGEIRTAHHNTVELAAWMFLLRLGYGLDGAHGLIRLNGYHSSYLKR
jgi:hypothetical protein